MLPLAGKAILVLMGLPVFTDPAEVSAALAGFTGKNRRAHGRAIDEYVRKHRDLIKRNSPRDEQPLATRGRVHDLAELYDSTNARYFENKVHARIGWGR